jgi:hypothetical protein
MVPDRGDRCLFIFLWSRRRFFDVFPFPVCNEQLLGDWYENRGGTPNTIIFLIIRKYIGAPMYPAPIVMADQTFKKSAKHNLNIIGAPMPPAQLIMAHWT